MKPSIVRIASVPVTTVMTCSQCYGVISYPMGTDHIQCEACGALLQPRACTASKSNTG